MSPSKTTSHLRVVRGEGLDVSDTSEAQLRRDRIKLKTIFIETDNRKNWITRSINTFWSTHATQLAHLVSQAPEDTNNTALATIGMVRTSFLMARKIPATAELTQFLDSLALLAYHCYRQIAQKTIDIRSAEYSRAYTSTDMYHEGAHVNNPQMKSAQELATLIAKKSFNLDTSLFEKEVARASVTAAKPTENSFPTILSAEDLYQYLLVLFTAFNQKKAISYPQS